jgi:hypothetical protein
METKSEREARLKKEQEERDVRLEQAKASAKSKGESEAARANTIYDAAAGAEETERQAMALRTFAEDPAAAKMFGLLSRPGLWPAIGRLIETGVGANQFRVGIPELQTALTTAGLTTDEIAKYQTALQSMVNFQLRMSQFVKGAVSNYEQGLFQKASINQNDLPETIRMKSNMAIVLSDFARRKAELFENSGLSTTKFIRSNEYQKLLRDTNDKLEAMAGGKGVRRADKKNPSQRLNDILGEQ